MKRILKQFPSKPDNFHLPHDFQRLSYGRSSLPVSGICDSLEIRSYYLTKILYKIFIQLKRKCKIGNILWLSSAAEFDKRIVNYFSVFFRRLEVSTMR